MDERIYCRILFGSAFIMLLAITCGFVALGVGIYKGNVSEILGGITLFAISTFIYLISFIFMKVYRGRLYFTHSARGRVSVANRTAHPMQMDSRTNDIPMFDFSLNSNLMIDRNRGYK